MVNVVELGIMLERVESEFRQTGCRQSQVSKVRILEFDLFFVSEKQMIAFFIVSIYFLIAYVGFFGYYCLKGRMKYYNHSEEWFWAIFWCTLWPMLAMLEIVDIFLGPSKKD